MVTVAPWLRIVVNIGAEWTLKVALAVLKEFPLFPKKTKEMKALIDALGVKEKHGEQQTFEENALKAMADMANEEENSKKWRDEMEPVVGENGRTMWVKKRLEDRGHWC
ncbi:hypothetical protein MHU86_23962 [Fragilaria crotonensis]|nr:hypothetical protein MHU86_23962 [Fragilaria crotonensis]